MLVTGQELIMGRPEIIAIDGPAASGKTTLAFRLAEKLGYLFFDTGVMYRAVTWAIQEHHIASNDEASVSQLAETINIDVRPPSIPDGRSCDVLVDGRDVTWAIRQAEVEAAVSQVSAYAGVRKAMTYQQRRIGLRGKVVMVGRDIGTVVLPEAELKVYLDASVEERARRRFNELVERGEAMSYEAILSAMRKRDEFDSTRPVAPLKPALDARIVNSDGLDADKVLAAVEEMIAE
jgi:CMP/dCMP kinase